MKHKKKQNTTQIKQEQLHQRNLFFKKMQHTMALLGDASAFGLLSKQQLENMFYFRLRPLKVISQNKRKQKCLANDTDFMNKTITWQLQRKFIEIGENKVQFNYCDFRVYVESLSVFWEITKENRSASEARFKACFPLFKDNFLETRAQVFTEVQKILHNNARTLSDIAKKTIRYEPEPKIKSLSRNNSVCYNNYIVIENKPETEILEIDGNRRTIYRVFLTAYTEFIPLTIPPEKLGTDGLMQKSPLRVFIQMHALERIETRLGKLFREFSYPFITIALQNADYIPADKKNCFLIPVENGITKLGYLKADVIGDKLVIRTFLFITNNGTPEGKKLNQLVGLQKADKKYLGIDKLSTFIQSDIKKDEKLKALFCEAGCSDLFKLDKTWLDDKCDKELATAQYITKYLGI
jgi:hypothetical protein